MEEPMNQELYRVDIPGCLGSIWYPWERARRFVAHLHSHGHYVLITRQSDGVVVWESAYEAAPLEEVK
jgi:hypothetical protein